MTDTERQRPSLSFEIFPPNTKTSNELLLDTLDELQDLGPHFISVTCSNKQANLQTTTLKLAGYIQKNLKVPSIAHITAAYSSKQEIREALQTLERFKTKRILALRGDIYEDKQPTGDFQHASELIQFIKQEDPTFQISGACHPEIHPESASRVADLHHLKEKVDSGCDDLITQLFFDNDIFYRFRENCEMVGIDVPIYPGIMPIVNRKQALRLIQTTKTALPRKFVAILEKYEHDPASLRAAGLAYAIDQIVDLVTQDSAGIHLYTMNQSQTALSIYRATKTLFKEEALVV